MFVRRFYSTPIGNLKMFSRRYTPENKDLVRKLYLTDNIKNNNKEFSSYQHMYQALKYKIKKN